MAVSNLSLVASILVHADDLAERRSDLTIENEVGMGVHRGRFAIEDHQPCAISRRKKRKSSGREDDERRADRDKEVGKISFRLGNPHCRLGHRLAKRDRCGLYARISQIDDDF